MTTVGSSISNQLASILVSSQNPTIALALCYVSQALVGVMGLVAVVYNLRIASPAPAQGRRVRGQPARGAELGEPDHERPQALVQGSQYWMILSVAAILPILWSFTLALHFARPYILRYLQG